MRTAPHLCLLAAALCGLAAASLRAAPSSAVSMDLAPMRVGEVLQELLVYDNPAGSALEGIHTKTSCKCLEVLACMPRVGPNEKGWIEVRLTPDEAGDFAYTCQVLAAGPDGKRAAVLTFVLNVTVEETEAETRGTGEGRLYVSASELRAGAGPSRSPLFVDTRRANVYAEAHIPGSLSIPLHAVKTKGFLRGRRLVLVDGGWGDRRTEDACRGLLQRGFRSVAILFGGLNAWSRSGGRLAGRLISPARLARISPLEFAAARGGRWIVADASAEAVADADLLLPGRVPFTPAQTGSGFPVELLKRKLAAGGRPVRVLIVTADGRNADAALRALAALDECVVFTLQGGIEGMRRQRAMTVAMRAPAEARTYTARDNNAGTNRRPCSCR